MFILQNQIPHKLETYESVNNFYPPRKIFETLAVSGFATLATIASSVAVALPASAISFNLSYTTGGSAGTPFTVNALLETSDSSPTATANQTYTITNISGTVNNGIAITGLNNSVNLFYGIVNNQFKWDGGSNIALTHKGIGFNTFDSKSSKSYGIVHTGVGANNGTFYFADNGVNQHFSSDSGYIYGGLVTASNLSLTPATPVPFDFDPSFGLLALGGAWTVRKMIKKSKSVVKK